MSSRYSIKAEYSTGDSFHTEETSCELPMVWESLETAKIALQWLNEHHSYQQADEHSYRCYTSTLDISDVKSKPWYCEYPDKGVGYEDYWHQSITLPLDDGTFTKTYVPYHGYFEHLYSLEIVEDHYDRCFKYN